MNKNIIDLARKTNMIDDNTTLANLEKIDTFAKEVVNECMRIMISRTNNKSDDGTWVHHNNAIWCCYGDIRDHFDTSI